jgi:hypothetical protein
MTARPSRRRKPTSCRANHGEMDAWFDRDAAGSYDEERSDRRNA